MHCIVNELSGLGLKPAILHELIEASVPTTDGHTSGIEDVVTTLEAPPPPQSSSEPSSLPIPIAPSIHAETETRFSPIPRVVYELNDISGRIEPRLRIWINTPTPEVEFREDVGGHLSQALEALHLEHDEGGELVAEIEPGGHERSLWGLQQEE